MNIQAMKDYLSSLEGYPTEDKRYVLNFCKRLEYMDQLREQATKESGQDIEMGYGNINSKTCFIFQNKEEQESLKGVLQPFLDQFGIHLWEHWATFINKTEREYPNKYTLLVNELSTMKPDIMYLICKDKSEMSILENVFFQANVSYPKEIRFIDIALFFKDDPQSKAILCKQFN